MNANATNPATLTADQIRQARCGVYAWNAHDFASAQVSGADATAFLTNLLTADLRKIPVGSGALTFQCTPRGMAEAMLTVAHVAGDQWLLIGERSDHERLLAYFERMHFSEAVTFENHADELGCIALQGAGSDETLRKLLADNAHPADLPEYGTRDCKLRSADSTLTVVRRSLLGDPGWLLLVNHRGVEALLDQLAALEPVLVRADAALREALRIEAGVPAFGVDIQRNGLAQEVGIQHPAFNYNQGCYVGQEIIARINTKGEVPFRLMGLVMPGVSESPEPNTRLFGSDGKAAGSITSALLSPTLGHAIAIARIGRGYQLAGARLHVASADGPVATTCEFPIVDPALHAPANHHPLYDEALTLFAKGEEDAALGLLRQELDAHPDNWDAWEAMGVILGRQEKYREAIDAIKRIADAQPEHLMANVNLSLFHMKVGDKATAEEFQAKATQISLKRRMDEARAKGQSSPDAEAERMQQLASRLEKFRAIIEMDPGDVLGHFGAGKACMDLKRFGEAAKHFEDVLAIQRDYSVAWANLGTCLVSLGENDRARKVFEDGIEVAKLKGDLMPMRDMQTRLANLTA